MKLTDRINQDLKQALLGGNQAVATTLRGLKGVILNAEIAEGKREQGLGDDAVVVLLQKEVKKRRETIEIYQKAGESERAAKEQAEIEVIAQYLPEAMSDEELTKLVDEALAELENPGPAQMGQIIGQVKAQAGASADGAVVARLVKEKLSA